MVNSKNILREDYLKIPNKKNFLKMNLYNLKDLYDKGNEQEMGRSNLFKAPNATSNWKFKRYKE